MEYKEGLPGAGGERRGIKFIASSARKGKH